VSDAKYGAEAMARGRQQRNVREGSCRVGRWLLLDFGREDAITRQAVARETVEWEQQRLQGLYGRAEHCQQEQELQEAPGAEVLTYARETGARVASGLEKATCECSVQSK
jgi:hypothetical protein